MEVKASTIFGAVLAAMMVIQTLALPLSQDAQVGQANMPADKRPKYMDTRDLSAFKAFLLASINDLIEEGVLSSRILAEPKPDDEVISPKKRAHIGLCFNLTPSGNPVARPCWMNQQS